MRRAELIICHGAKSEIDQYLIRGITHGGISMSEVKIASDSEPRWSENIEYF